jgi:spermidine synthase
MGKGLNKIIGFSIVLSGFCALSSQIVFLREFLIIFYGNELSIGFIFASWLFSVAVGSFAYGLISSKVKGKITLLCCCFTALSLLLPASLIAIQLSKTIMHFAVGEIVPLFPIAVSSFILLFPVCLFFGFIFSLCCELYQLNLKSVSAKISAVYILEAIGSGLAGILVSFFLIRFFDSLEIIIFTAIFNLITALLLVFFSQGAARKLFIILTSSILLLFLFFLNQGVMEKVAHRVQNLQWQGYRVLASKNSIYANLTVAERNKQISFFENGLLLYAVPGNKMQEEESIHFAMLENPNPKEVLLIGGGVGLLDEILKYPVNRVDYLEIDSLIIKLTKKYLPRDLQKSLNDKRVEIKNLDARFFVKSAKEKYDCIIIHTGSPPTAQLNRYYTVDFFRQLKALLKENGVVSFALNSSENYFNKELREFLQSIYF